MPYREKVIKGLEVCVDREPGKYNCNECPYEIDGNWCEINLAKDALILLKEQDPVKPIPFFESPNYVVCGHCKSIKAIMPKHTKQKYCHECGTPVLWEGL